jgi:4-amino-4-deoxy-L-arabinose transferase-like glycosyltransferase
VQLQSRQPDHSERDPARTARLIVAIALGAGMLALVCAPLAPLFDPDEGYYPATAAETLRSGPFWDLRFNGAPRWDKPVLAYALIEGAFITFGSSVTAARLPSAIEGAALVAIVGFVVARLTTARAAVLSALTVGTCLGFSIFARVAHPDIAVVLSIVTTELLICLWLASPDVVARRRTALAAGASIAYGLLAKGPVAAALPVLAMAVSIPWLPVRKTLSVLAGDALRSAAVTLVLASPWYIAMALRHGASFLREAVWQQNIGRYATASYGHRAGPLFLLIPLLVGLLPWTGFLPAALARVRQRGNGERDVLRTVMVASAISALAFYSLSHSKLASYVFVCIPPLAIAIALAMDEDFDDPGAMRRFARWNAILIGAGAATVLAAPSVLGHTIGPRQLLGGAHPDVNDIATLITPIALPLGCLLAITAVALARARTAVIGIAALAGAGAIAPVILLIAARPELAAMYPWQSFGPHLAARPAPAWILARRAPSLTFYARQPIVVAADRGELQADVERAAAGWIVLTRDQWAELAATETVKRGHFAIAAETGRLVLVRFVNVLENE